MKNVKSALPDGRGSVLSCCLYVEHRTARVSKRKFFQHSLRLELIEKLRARNATAAEINRIDVFDIGDILQWIAVEKNESGIVARPDKADVIVRAEQFGRVVSGSFERGG